MSVCWRTVQVVCLLEDGAGCLSAGGRCRFSVYWRTEQMSVCWRTVQVLCLLEDGAGCLSASSVIYSACELVGGSWILDTYLLWIEIPFIKGCY